MASIRSGKRGSMTEQEAMEESKLTKESMEVSCVFRASRTGDMKYPSELEALDIAISALEKQMKLKLLGFTEEVIRNYKIFEDECISKGMSFKDILEARDRQQSKRKSF